MPRTVVRRGPRKRVAPYTPAPAAEILPPLDVEVCAPEAAKPVATAVAQAPQHLAPAPKTHATVGSPSGMKALAECPGKLWFCRELPAEPESEYAIEGTRFHHYIETIVAMRLAAKTVFKAEVEEALQECPEDMTTYVHESTAKLMGLWERFCSKHDDCRYLIEERVKLNEDVFGTADVIFVGKNKRSGKIDLVLIDWKYGQGVLVEAFENLQAITYALCAKQQLALPASSIGMVVVIIAQVRIQDDWEKNQYRLEGDELDMWEIKVLEIVAKAKRQLSGAEPPLLQAGDHCRFCRGLATCPAVRSQRFDEVANTATELDSEAVLDARLAATPLAQLVQIFSKRKQVEKFLAAVGEHLHELLARGEAVDGVKLVAKAGRRAWDAKQDESILAKELIKLGVKTPWKQALIGITEAEKQVGKGKLGSLTVVGDGKREVALSSDPRDAVAIAPLTELF